MRTRKGLTTYPPTHSAKPPMQTSTALNSTPPDNEPQSPDGMATTDFHQG
jgi:hypothetical protein